MPSITRRKALAVTGASLTTALAGLARAGQTIPADSSLAQLERLIAVQQEAIKISIAKWTIVGDIEDSPAIQSIPECHVQVGRILGSRDEDGNDTYTPIYAYDDEGIERNYQPVIDAHLSMWGRTKAGRQKVLDTYATKVSAKKSELAALKAEAKRIEDECGYTTAMKVAIASSEAVKEVEAAIVSFIPATLAAASRQAEWVVSAYLGDTADEPCSYLTREHVLEALASIGKVVQS